MISMDVTWNTANIHSRMQLFYLWWSIIVLVTSDIHFCLLWVHSVPCRCNWKYSENTGNVMEPGSSWACKCVSPVHRWCWVWGWIADLMLGLGLDWWSDVGFGVGHVNVRVWTCQSVMLGLMWRVAAASAVWRPAAVMATVSAAHCTPVVSGIQPGCRCTFVPADWWSVWGRTGRTAGSLRRQQVNEWSTSSKYVLNVCVMRQPNIHRVNTVYRYWMFV